MKSMTIADIAGLLGVAVPAEGARVVTGMNTLLESSPSEISFLGSDAYVREFRQTKAAAVIVGRKVKLPEPTGRVVLLVDDADLAVAKVLERMAAPRPRPVVGVDAMARVDASAEIGEGVSIGPFVVVGARSRIGPGTVLHPGVYIGEDVSIGERCEFFANVVVRERISIGSRVIIHAGSVIGSDGFGYRWDGRQHAKVPQIGTVLIEDDVEIGSCVCVDRAKFSATSIGRGTKIDNLVQIAHNCQIGPHCIIVGQTGLAGSVRLGAGVVMGGQSAVRDHVNIGDGVTAGARSAIIADVEAGTAVSGVPAMNHRQHLREQAALRRLPDLVVQVRNLQDEVARLKAGTSVAGRP